MYDLIVYGNIIAGGTIDEPIKRHPVDRVKMAVLPGGKEAVTHYNVKERFQHFTRIQARLETGRTHQIRVHFSYLGYGLVGDQVYMPRVRMPAGASQLLMTPCAVLNVRHACSDSRPETSTYQRNDL